VSLPSASEIETYGAAGNNGGPRVISLADTMAMAERWSACFPTRNRAGDVLGELLGIQPASGRKSLYGWLAGRHCMHLSTYDLLWTQL
jgi:hypothetical protein